MLAVTISLEKMSRATLPGWNIKTIQTVIM
jgi:hypothetical protein